MKKSIEKNLETIRERVAAAARRANRDPRDIKLLAVSKKVPWERIKEAVACGQLLYGENYVQEARTKIPQLGQDLIWHFIGHLQSNKIKPAVELFQVIQTVDRVKLAVSLNNHLAALSRSMSVFIQINIGKEPRKAGVLPEKAEQLLRAVNELQYLRVAGLMAIPPFTADPGMARPYFRQMREMLADFMAKKLLGRHGQPELSMGMSHDFEAAIEEGATLVRVGTAIFGQRD